MDEKLIKKKEYLVKNIPKLIRNFDYRKGPDLYFYKRVITEVRKNQLKDLLERNDFIELLYITLVSWDMNARGAKMKYFDDFKESVLKNKKYFEELSRYKLDKTNKIDFSRIKGILGEIYDNLNLMRSRGKLVSNSKLMHYLLPDLVMPMDRYHTLNFFFGNTGETKKKFLDIIECTYYVVREIDLREFLDDEWNQSIPKIIDNAIICAQSEKYRKNR